VGKIPDLLEQLIKDAEATTQRIKGKIDQANQLAKAIQRAEKEPTQPPITTAVAEAAISEIERKYGKGSTDKNPPTKSVLRQAEERAKNAK
jgi:hypothetical protein